MRPYQPPQRFLTLFSGLPVESFFDEVTEEDCPSPVAECAWINADSGRIERILKGRGSRRGYYFVEIKLNERVERRLQISAEGTLLSQVDRIRESELPKTVKTAMNEFIAAGARFDGADHVLTTEREEFHIELDLGDDRDLHLFLDDRGVLLRQHEVGDF